MSYTARFRVFAIVEVPVAGATLAEALENAKTVRQRRLVTIKGEYLHGGYKLTGVDLAEAWNDDIVEDD